MAKTMMRMWYQGHAYLYNYSVHQPAKAVPLLGHPWSNGQQRPTDIQNQRRFSKVIQSCYETLEVSRKATQSQIKAAYYRLSKKYHPDMNQSREAKQRFAEISEAYAILGNKQSRRQYDLGLGRVADGRTRKTDGDHPYYADIGNRGFRSRTGPMTGKASFYDFDKFYKEHYGESLKESQAGKDAYKEYLRLMEQARTESLAKQTIYMFSMFSLVLGFLVSRAKRLKKF